MCAYALEICVGLTAHLGAYDFRHALYRVVRATKPALYRGAPNSAAPSLLKGLSRAKRFHQHYTGHPHCRELPAAMGATSLVLVLLWLWQTIRAFLGPLSFRQKWVGIQTVKKATRPGMYECRMAHLKMELHRLSCLMPPP